MRVSVQGWGLAFTLILLVRVRVLTSAVQAFLNQKKTVTDMKTHIHTHTQDIALTSILCVQSNPNLSSYHSLNQDLKNKVLPQ